tara:strand:+ start:613 stop:912 length:300 start_codon:yes stop_codon:yes gene_type:complete
MTLSDQLRAAHEDALKLQAEVRELEARLADSQRQKFHYSKQHDNASSELEQAHAVLDGVSGAPPREYTSSNGYGTQQRSVATRLAGVFLALAQTGKVTQ